MMTGRKMMTDLAHLKMIEEQIGKLLRIETNVWQFYYAFSIHNEL